MRYGRRGAAAVEMALVFPLWLALALGTLEIGRAWFSYNLLTHAVREGARLASVRPGLQQDDPAVVNRVTQILQDGKISPKAVDLSYTPPLLRSGLIRVTAQIDHNLLASSFFPGAQATIPFTADVQTRYEI